ncbi:MAG: glycosyltransferase [Enterococcus sp.]|nr:glycosyltransferase [Enterococcus sp.]
MVKQIKVAYSKKINLIKVPVYWNSWNSKTRKVWHMLVIIYLKFIIKNKDRILFMELLGNRSGDQTGLALKLRKYGIINKFIGLVHLSPINLTELYEDELYIINSLNSVDKILMFGTSLETYFIKLGFKDKMRRTFHYVDTGYYHPLGNRKENHRLRVICIGSIKRDHELLKEIIIQCSFADFIICMGLSDYSDFFQDINNISIHGYLEEKELLKLMQFSDVSLSVLHDTVGSNVIVTSMATGLVNIVSDVGSIRDYCSENDSILCKDKNDFIKALEKLDNNKSFLNTLSRNSIEKAKEFELQRFIREFPELLD